MGLQVSSLFSPKELEDIKGIQRLQEIAKRFIVHDIYYGVPVRSGQKSLYDPIGMLWIEPMPDLVDGPDVQQDLKEVRCSVMYSLSINKD